MKDLQTLKRNAPDPNDEDLYKSGLDKRKAGSISQYEFAFQIAQTSYAYAIEGDEKYLEAAKCWTFVACAMPIWGYTCNKPNVDLPPAHLLYAVAFAYNGLFDRLNESEKETIRNKLIKQARLMYDYFKYKDKKRYTYTQNHTWIPMAGLAIAAYVLMDESEEAKSWAQLSRAVYDRTMLAFGTDGFFYESFHYFGFAFRWMIRYFDAHRHATGENLYAPMRGKFERMKYFVMHSILPDRENVFDFADVGDGSLNRNKTGKREKLYGEYDILYRFAGIYQNAEAQTVADFVRTKTSLDTREPMWAFINHDANLKPAPLSNIPTYVYFNDNDTVFWRSDWTPNATAFAFRCAPPEGHYAARFAPKISDWRQNTGHAHPDANSFIIFAKGKYLTGDTGYLGIKQTDDHNTILVNSRGQERDGVYEMFKEVSNEKLDKIRIVETSGNKDYFYARGEAASGYYGDLGLKKFDRHFLYIAPETFIWFNQNIKSVPIEQQEKWHYFKDHEVVFWRDSWQDEATAFSFKAGPPEGHATAEKVRQFPDWRLSSGHAHPDAGSFIIWANKKYLTGDSGYAGVPLTEHHNTLTFDGKGQAKEGKGHDAFANVSYNRLNQIRLTDVKMDGKKVSIVADLMAAYEPEVGVKRFVRKFEFAAPNRFIIKDMVETERRQIITTFLHSDNVIWRDSEQVFTFEPNGTSLTAEIVAPKTIITLVEKNILTAPGRPGSVDKGEREERGVRLAISTAEKTNKLDLEVRLKIKQE